MTTGDGRGGRTAGVDPLERGGDDRRRATLRADGHADGPIDGRAEDRTAADAFAELRDGLEPTDPDAVLEESPEALVENADEPADESADRDDLLDEDALEDLLLPDRTEAYGFRWIETPEPDDESAAAEADSAAGRRTDPLDGIEFDPDAESDAPGSDRGAATDDGSSDDDAGIDGADRAGIGEVDGADDGDGRLGREDVGPVSGEGDERDDAAGGHEHRRDADRDERDADGESRDDADDESRSAGGDGNRNDIDGDENRDDTDECRNDADGENRNDADSENRNDADGRGVLSRVRSILGRNGAG